MFIKNVSRKAHTDPKGLLFRKICGSRKGYSYHKGTYTCMEAAVQHAMVYKGLVMLCLSFWGKRERDRPLIPQWHRQKWVLQVVTPRNKEEEKCNPPQISQPFRLSLQGSNCLIGECREGPCQSHSVSQKRAPLEPAGTTAPPDPPSHAAKYIPQRKALKTTCREEWKPTTTYCPPENSRLT